MYINQTQNNMRIFKHLLCTLLLALTSVGAWADNFATGDGTIHTFKVSDVAKVSTLKSTGSWTISMEIETNGSSYNQWGSVAIASGTTAFDNYSFQLYMNKEGNKNGTLTLFDTDTGIASKYNFTAELKYNGTRISGHFIGKDASGNAKEIGANDSWYFTRTLTDITDLSYALPVGVNIKTLTITTNYDPEPQPTVPTGTTVYLHDIVKNLCLMQSDSYATDTKAQFQHEGSPVTLTAVGGVDNGYTISLNGTGKYLSCNHNGSSGWKATSSTTEYTWIIEPVTDGWTIKASTQGSGSGLYLGQNSGASVGTGIYSNQTSAFTWNFWTETEYNEHLAEVGKTYTIIINGIAEGGGMTYAGNDYTTSFSSYKEITTGVLTPIPVAGYQANITMEGTTITVTYTANQVVDNPQAISGMLNRIGGTGTSDKFVTRLDEGLFANGKDKFIIGNQDGKPYIQGSSMTAIATGINWYLNHDAHINISWNQLTADIAGASLPEATPTEKTCDADYRYYLNYCTFGYSMTTWTWDRWQKEIDWMALHGINMPLQIVGLEEVWRKVLVQYNYTDDEAKAFAAGPAFTAWWGMNNLEGWGGTTDNAWFARQAKLGKDICDRMKELGMQPVLPGFAAIVPHDFTSKNPAYASESQGNWGGSFVRPWIMDPSGAKFSEVAERYYQALEEVLGTSKYYSMDPFHEGGAISSGKYSEGYKAIYDAMNDNCGSDTKWVIQQWQWAGYQRNSLTAVPAGRLIVLDLFADGQPAFDSYNGYAPQEAVFSTIPNFGGRSGFMGRLDNMASNYFTYKGKYSTLKGIGAAPEAIESVPVVYDLLFELPWMGTAPNVTAWVADYATNRYGIANANAQKAWKSIHQSAMAFGADAIQGPIEDVWAARPNLDATPASKWGKTIANAASIYTPERRQKLISAIYDLVSESDNLGGSNYQYDIIEAGSQVMADYAYDLLLGIKAAKTADNETLFNQRKDAFLSLILGMDAFKGTHQMFRLGNWTQTARDAAAEVQGATTATPDWYELDNARTILTTWGDKGPSEWGLRDYSYRSWQGLLKDYYYPRWEYYFSHDCTAPSAGWFYSEWNWAHELEGEWGASAKGTQMKAERTYYTPAPEGNTVDEANKLLAKYILPVQLTNKSVKYVYRALETDLTSVLTVDAVLGAPVAMPIVGETNIDGETVTAVIKLDGTELDNMTIPNDATKGVHNAEYIINDGTVVRFKVNVDNEYATGDITGDGKIHFMHAKDYITNIDEHGVKKYETVPTGKAWQFTMDVTHVENQTASYNQWGSCIISSSSDPLNTFYWNNFQVYEHSGSEGSKRGTLNFKSNKGDGNDHVIAQGHKVYQDDTNGYEDYRVIVRYDGNQTYLIRTIILDAEGNPTNQVFNNVWIAARVQNAIDVMSCALPTGTSLKNLAISIAEESNLMEDVDYAVQNIGNKKYLTGNALDNSIYAGDAAHYQIEWTGNKELTYTDTDGGLHQSFYIKVLDNNGDYQYLMTGENQTAFIYSENSKQIQPITAKNTVGDAWAIDENKQWLWDFFANFYVEVAGNNNGGLLYMKNGGQQTATNGQYLELPASVTTDNLANSSQVGYMATISKADIRLKVQYSPLLNTFYNITAKTPEAQPVLYYWYKDQQTLVTYSTTNSQSGKLTDWGEKGDCSKFTIAQANKIPIKISFVKSAYYGSIYCPNALTLPEGIIAYRLRGITEDNNYLLSPIEGEILPAGTPALLVSEEGVQENLSGDWAISLDGPSAISGNQFLGAFENSDNPGNGQSDNSPIYVLGNKPDIGFYRYVGSYIPAFKAYYYSTAPTASGKFLFTYDNDDLTSISTSNTEEPSAPTIIYDLMGRKVTQMEKNKIYIINGKTIKNI